MTMRTQLMGDFQPFQYTFQPPFQALPSPSKLWLGTIVSIWFVMVKCKIFQAIPPINYQAFQDFCKSLIYHVLSFNSKPFQVPYRAYRPYTRLRACARARLMGGLPAFPSPGATWRR